MAPRARVRASVVCEAEGHLLVVLLRDPVTKLDAYFPPGGGIEEGETPAETARRETLEETGLRVRIDDDPKVTLVTDYPFRWANQDYAVTTHFVAASLEEPFQAVLPKVIDAPYNLGPCWLPIDEALKAMNVYPAIATPVGRVMRRARRKGWQKSPNIAGPASTLLAIHDQFRVGSERLVHLVEHEAEADLPFVARAFRPLSATLHHHHHAEEAMLFPLVLARTGKAPEQLVSDHEELTSAITEVEEALGGRSPEKARAVTAAAAFHEILNVHLDREESLVIPVLLTMSPAEAWGLIQGG